MSAGIWYIEESNEEQEEIADNKERGANEDGTWGDSIYWCPLQFNLHTPQIKSNQRKKNSTLQMYYSMYNNPYNKFLELTIYNN